MSDEPVVTMGAQMRAAREKGVLLLFPSGNTYRVRMPNAAGLLRRGNLPNVLLSFCVDAFYNGVTYENVDTFLAAKEKSENALELMESFRVICEEMLLEPRVVTEPKADNEVSIVDVPMVDQVLAFKLTFLGVEALFPFRAESQPDVVSVPSPQAVPQTTE